MSETTATSKEVLDYYARNWEQITRCYDLGEDDLPLDPAYYRRLIYLRILRTTGADRILDIGCGGGRTVLDALEMGRVVRGIEPTTELVSAARKLLRDSGRDPDMIAQDDMISLRSWKPRSFGTVSALSVLPHVAEAQWDETHNMLANLIVEGGYFIASYRNDLFDLFTFNSFTVEFVVDTLLNNDTCKKQEMKNIKESVESLLTHPKVPGSQFTTAKDKSFGSLTRVNSNPLTIRTYLSQFGLKLVKLFFFNYHCVPPLLADRIPDYQVLSHEMNLTLAEDWHGYFMASTFLVLAKKGTPSD
ncbi:MAG: class I SAM-dependent methyltransferase [Nitrososphaera sp.]|nr:class I SAM-dependent methyltransferase [Nitrososphaera sp.]